MRKNIKSITNSQKSDFNFRLSSKNNTLYTNMIITILLILIFLILIVLFYLDYKTTQRIDSLFMNYQNLFDRQSVMNIKLEEYLKEITPKENIPSEENVVNNSARINKILYRIGGIVVFYFAALGVGFIHELINNPANFDIYTLFPELGPMDPPNNNNDDDDTRFLQNNTNLQGQIMAIEPENPDDDNRIILPAHDPNVVQIIPGPGDVVINEGIQDPHIEEQVEFNSDTE